jgi:hypothetical protein
VPEPVAWRNKFRRTAKDYLHRGASGHVEYGASGVVVVDDSRIFQNCVKVKDYSAAGVFQTHTGDNDFVAFRIVSGVCRNCARVDDSARDIKRAWDKYATGIFNVARAVYFSKVVDGDCAVLDESSTVVDGTKLGDSRTGIVVGAVVADNALVVDDPLVLEESAGTNHEFQSWQERQRVWSRRQGGWLCLGW